MLKLIQWIGIIILMALACKSTDPTKIITVDLPYQIELAHSPNEAELFGEGLISTELYERDMAISPDGKEMIYTLGNYKQTTRSLVIIRKENQKWGEKQILSFSGKYQDIEPFYSVDGSQLFFASNRPIGSDVKRKDYNIWVSKKIDGKWDKPQALGTHINTSKDEFYPSVSKNGNLYFTATRSNGVGREDIFLSQYLNGKYQDPMPLDSNVNSKVYEFNAYINPEEDLLIFSSFGRKDGFGGGDLYFSQKDASGKWSSAKNMGSKVNTDKLDYCPFIDIPRGNFYFTSEHAPSSSPSIKSVAELKDHANEVLNGMGNIFRINIKELDLE